ncbi:MAG: IS66 family transposase, partial [Gammaproteobacteria bacterium]
IASLQTTVTSMETALAELQKQLVEATNGNAELTKQLSELNDRLENVLHQLEKRKKKDHGKKTERHNPRQALASGSHPEQLSSSVQPSAKKPNKNKNHKKNINLQDLPVAHAHHTVSPEERICPTCQIETVAVGEKLSSQLERIKHSLARLEHHQEVRSCPKCKQHIVTARKPEPPFPGGLPTAHLLSSIIVGKLADGLPNYRQQKMFKREHATIPRSTQCDWMIAGSLTLEPLYERLKRLVLQSKVIRTDDTWVKIQDRTHPDNIRKGKMTPYLGDKQHPYTVFEASPTQSFAKNKEFLKDFSGFVQADAANGFDALFADGTKTEIGCNAHARRKFDESEPVEPEACGEILDIYSSLYKIEKDIKDKDPAEKLAQRQQKSKPLTLDLHQKLLTLQQSLNPKNPAREAVDYTLRHWIALTRFLDDPDFKIDNNDTEQAIKTFVLMRKNSLFFGSDAGATASAMHLSFIASCERNNIDPLEYLTDVFTRINSMKTSELDELLPDRWASQRKTKPPP